jgi:hypothetical protein
MRATLQRSAKDTYPSKLSGEPAAAVSRDIPNLGPRVSLSTLISR